MFLITYRVTKTGGIWWDTAVIEKAKDNIIRLLQIGPTISTSCRLLVSFFCKRLTLSSFIRHSDFQHMALYSHVYKYMVGDHTAHSYHKPELRFRVRVLWLLFQPNLLKVKKSVRILYTPKNPMYKNSISISSRNSPLNGIYLSITVFRNVTGL